ncbi:MAG: hypothetical protein AAF514_00290 [Verrucomicrobiota bacterium]
MNWNIEIKGLGLFPGARCLESGPVGNVFLSRWLLLLLTLPFSPLAAEPTEYEQYALELLNRARQDPAGEVQRAVDTARSQPGYFGGFNQYQRFTGAAGLSEGPPTLAGQTYSIAAGARQPVAYNERLFETSTAYSVLLQSNDSISHTLDNKMPNQRIKDNGYALGNPTISALQVGGLSYFPGSENLAFVAGPKWTADLQKQAIEMMHHNHFVDSQVAGRGHRITMLAEDWKEAAIGANWGRNGQFYSVYTTAHFGFRQGSGSLVTGVVYNDKDNDQFYTPGAGEPLSGIKVQAFANGSVVKETTNRTSGGYDLELPAGTYDLHFVGTGIYEVKKGITIGAENVKVDMIDPGNNPPVVSPPVDAPVVAAFTASSSAITCGQSTTLRWTITGATSASIPGVGNVLPMTNGSGVGSVEVSPTKTTTYRISIENGSGTATKTVRIEVSLLAELTGSASKIDAGDSLTLSWNVCPGASVAIDPGYSNLSGQTNAQGSGSIRVTPNSDTTYTLTTTLNGQSMTRRVSVTVDSPPVATPGNVLSPGDPIYVVNGRNDGDGSDGPPPGAEGVDKVIDGVGQKYLNFVDLESGFVVTPSAGSTVATGIRFYPANDVESRDPASYELLGGNGGPNGTFTRIALGNLTLPSARNGGGNQPLQHRQEILFSNTTSYSSYKVIFPTLKNAGAVGAMQIAEVEILGLPGQPVVEVSNILTAGDQISIVNGRDDGDNVAGPPPGAEGVEQVIDGVGQKYLNFIDLDSGFVVTPAAGSTVASAIRFYPANDVEGRDPASFELHGGNDGPNGAFTLIASGGLSLPSSRNPGGNQPLQHFQEVTFANTAGYTSYKVVFPTLKDAGSVVAMQIAEVQIFGVPGTGSGGADVAGGIQAVRRAANGSMVLSLAAGSTYDIEYSPSLRPGSWTVIASGVSGSFEDSNAARRANQVGYYRGVRK